MEVDSSHAYYALKYDPLKATLLALNDITCYQVILLC